MTRKHLAIAAGLALCATPALALTYAPSQQGAVGTAITATDASGNAKQVVMPTSESAGTPFVRINTNATTTIKSGAGILHVVCVNTKGATANTVTLYDNTAASGTVIGVIDTTNSTGCLWNYNANFSTGLTAVTAAGTAADLTIVYR